MAKFVVVVAMLLIQGQPLVSAALCQRHHEMTARACAASSEERPDAMQHGEDGTAPSDHDCDRMLACSLVPPAIVPTDPPQIRSSFTYCLTIPRTIFPPAVVQARPFHPPKA
ncbi:MAG: hypothetical protein KJZ47_11740 [Gemmatimonadales bacterium]|nr:hypothetical protein [Gemmatimonadales bacterium]